MLTDGGVTSDGVPINRTGFHRYGWAYDLGAIPAQSKLSELGVFPGSLSFTASSMPRTMPPTGITPICAQGMAISTV